MCIGARAADEGVVTHQAHQCVVAVPAFEYVVDDIAGDVVIAGAGNVVFDEGCCGQSPGCPDSSHW